MNRLRMGEDVFMRLLPRRAHEGPTLFGKMGDVVQQPQVWAGLAGLLAFAGGPRGRRSGARPTGGYIALGFKGARSA